MKDKYLLIIDGKEIECDKKVEIIYSDKGKRMLYKDVYILNGSKLHEELPNELEINSKKFYKSSIIRSNGDFRLIQL